MPSGGASLDSQASASCAAMGTPALSPRRDWVRACRPSPSDSRGGEDLCADTVCTKSTGPFQAAPYAVPLYAGQDCLLFQCADSRDGWPVYPWTFVCGLVSPLVVANLFAPRVPREGCLDPWGGLRWFASGIEVVHMRRSRW